MAWVTSSSWKSREWYFISASWAVSTSTEHYSSLVSLHQAPVFYNKLLQSCLLMQEEKIITGCNDIIDTSKLIYRGDTFCIYLIDLGKLSSSSSSTTLTVVCSYFSVRVERSVLYSLCYRVGEMVVALVLQGMSAGCILMPVFTMVIKLAKYVPNVNLDTCCVYVKW